MLSLSVTRCFKKQFPREVQYMFRRLNCSAFLILMSVRVIKIRKRLGGVFESYHRREIYTMVQPEDYIPSGILNREGGNET